MDEFLCKKVTQEMFIPSDFTVNESDIYADLFSTISGTFSDVI